MRSGTSCFKTLLRSDWRRFWPVAFVYALLSFFILPLGLWNGVRLSYVPEDVPLAVRLANGVYEILPGFVLLNFFVGLALAMVLFGYLMKSNSVGLMHALPVSRDGQLAAHFAAGLSMLTAVNLLTVVLTVVMELALGGVEWKSLLLWLVIVELTGFFFLAFATLCAAVTGWLLGVAVIYGGLNLVVLAYYGLLQAMTALLCPGYGDHFVLSRGVEWLTPIVKLMHLTGEQSEAGMIRGYTVYALDHRTLPTVLIYAVVGLLMLALTLVLYRARHSERAGDAIVFTWLRPVVRYVIALAAGLGLGFVIYEIFWRTGSKASAPILAACQIFMGTLAYLAVEMLLRKSYRIFDKRTAMGLAALWLVIIALCACIRLDVTGIARRVPEKEQVASAELSVGYQGNVQTDDPAVIGALTRVHRAMTQQTEPAEDRACSVRMTYRLQNGSAMGCSYLANLDDPEVIGSLTELINQPLLRQSVLVNDYGKYGETFTGGWAFNDETGEEIILTADQCLALYRALEADMENPVTVESWVGEGLWCCVQLETTEGGYDIRPLREDCTHTLALLAEYGIAATWSGR